MGAYCMEASQINYRGGDHKMSVEEAIKGLGKSGITYATTEFDTNNKWVDGNEIYGKIISFEGIGGTTPIEVDGGLPENASVIYIGGMSYGVGTTSSYTGDLAYPIVKNAGSPNTASGIGYNKTTGKFLIAGNNTNMSAFKGFIEVHYVKAQYPPVPETP